MMKKRLALAILAVLLIVFTLPVLAACDKDSGASGDTLTVYNWEDYIDEDLLDEFADYYEEVTGRSLSVTYTTFDTNETMMTKVLKGDANVDLICPSEYAIEKLMTSGQGFLKNINELADNLQNTLDGYGLTLNNFGNIDPQIMAAIKGVFGSIETKGKTFDMTEYMVPYMWGTLGILYNRDKVSLEELEQYGWGILWNEGNNPDLENNILVKDSIRDTYCAAVLYLKEYGKLPEGYDSLSIADLINCTDQELLNAAEKALTEQRSHIAGYEVDFGKDDMVNEIVYADLAWSGDALWAIEESEYNEETEEYKLGYYVPEIGSNIWYDGWVIPNSAKNDLAALMFIDYMCRPVSAIRNAMAIGYTCAVDKTLIENDGEATAIIVENEYDLEEYFGDEGRYPVIDDRLGVMRNFGSANESAVQMWERAKAGNDVPWVLIWCLIALGGAGLIGFGGFAFKEYLKRKPKRQPAGTEDTQSKT